ncbi:MAG: hypothetical protein FJZ11_01845 [Candidatus Omnitrophica bacterium]|nr:hypothetical protein [Candidatus Omnitrophota bacterium]
MTKADLGKTSMGLQPNIAALLSYVLGWITGLIFFLVEKNNKFVRFHALQSLILFGVLQLASIVLIFTIIGPVILGTISLALWLVLMITSYQGKKIKIPIVAELAEKYS